MQRPSRGAAAAAGSRALSSGESSKLANPQFAGRELRANVQLAAHRLEACRSRLPYYPRPDTGCSQWPTAS